MESMVAVGMGSMMAVGSVVAVGKELVTRTFGVGSLMAMGMVVAVGRGWSQ